MINRFNFLLSIIFIFTQLSAANDKLFFGPCNSFSKDMKFDCYHDFKEMSQFLKDAHKQYPQFTKLESIGKSYEGRDLWVLTVTDFSIGEPENKPGIWIDGCAPQLPLAKLSHVSNARGTAVFSKSAVYTEFNASSSQDRQAPQTSEQHK